jgi:hypothetical protein
MGSSREARKAGIMPLITHGAENRVDAISVLGL